MAFINFMASEIVVVMYQLLKCYIPKVRTCKKYEDPTSKQMSMKRNFLTPTITMYERVIRLIGFNLIK